MRGSLRAHVASAYGRRVSTIEARSRERAAGSHTASIAAAARSQAASARASRARTVTTPPIPSTATTPSPTQRRRARRGSTASASSSSRIDGWRAAGSRASPRSSTRRSCVGTFAPRGGSAIAPRLIAAATSAAVAPSKGRTPQSDSQAVTQNAN